jgi:hypothetical protein
LITERYIRDIAQVEQEEWNRGVVVGNEGCIYAALSEQIEQIIKIAKNKSLPVRYITPFIPEKYISQIYNKIEEYSKSNQIKVVFNDYGLLYKCKSLIEDKKIIPILGRVLTRSIIDCPWADKLLSSEYKEYSDIILGLNFNHGSKLEFLKKYHIEEIEVNIPKKNYINEFGIPGINLTAYRDNSIISIGRVCFQARYEKRKISDCKKEKMCGKELIVTLNKRIREKKVKGRNLNKELCEDMGEMYVRGNVVYRKVSEDDYMKVKDYLYCLIES